MNKEQLKKYIEKMGVEAEMQELLYRVIDASETVDKQLYQTIATMLDAYAEYLDRSADLLEEEEEAYGEIVEELNVVDAEEEQAQAEGILQAQQNLLKALGGKLEEKIQEVVPSTPSPTTPAQPTATATPASTTTEDDAKMDSLRGMLQDLQQKVPSA